jgi:hypothetical protein
MRCRLTFPPIGRLPSTVSATDSRQFCSRFRRYYAAVRLLTASAAASSPRLPAVAHIRRSGVGEMRSPRFRRVPFIRNGVSDHGRAVAPRMTVRNVLPSTLSTVSASAELSLSRLNIPLHMIAVYASRPPSPATTQHLLQGGSLLPYPGRTFTGWTAPASPGALLKDAVEDGFGWASHSRLPAGSREEARPRAQLGGAGMQAGRAARARLGAGTVSYQAELGRNWRDRPNRGKVHR